MSDSNLLLESLLLMLIGMGIVFGFLLILVGLLRLMSTAVARLAPAEPIQAQPSAPSTIPNTSEDLIAVISAAIARYRNTR